MKSYKVFLLINSILLSAFSFAQKKEITFKKTVIFSEFEKYISEGVAAGDVNHDGKMDILAGTFWFEAPNWTRHEIDTPEIHSIGGYGNSFLNFTMDVNQDGCLDFIRIGFPSKEARWYENPKENPPRKSHASRKPNPPFSKGEKSHNLSFTEGEKISKYWKSHLVFHSVGNESPTFVDIDGDGKPDLLCNDPINKKVVWLSPPRKKGDTAWTTYIISNDSLIGTHLFTHGLGYGDVNGDGIKDVIIKDGWWEGRKDPTQPDWVFHPADLGPECSEMFVIDADSDGDSDIVSASAHNYGIWRHEQVKQGDTIAWIRHEIFKEFSQSHGLGLIDVNKDGYPDLITGKRFWAHNGNDPGEREPAVIYWFEFKPGKNPQWIPHLIDNDSGVGLHITTADMNKDGLLDIIVSNKKGIFLFEQNK